MTHDPSLSALDAAAHQGDAEHAAQLEEQIHAYRSGPHETTVEIPPGSPRHHRFVASALRLIASSFLRIVPASVPRADALMFAHAPRVLLTFAERIEGGEEGQRVAAVRQIRSVRWSCPSEAALLWREAVEAVTGMGEEGAAVATDESPAVDWAAMLRAERDAGRREGFEEARARAAKIARDHVCMSQQDVDNVEDDIGEKIEAMK